MGMSRSCVWFDPGKPSERCGRLVLSRRCGRSQWRSSRRAWPEACQRVASIQGLLSIEWGNCQDCWAFEAMYVRIFTHRVCRTSQAISTSLKNPDLAVQPLDKT